MKPLQSTEDITRKNIERIHRLDQAATRTCSFADRMAGYISRFCGSMVFVWFHIIFFASWLTINSLPGLTHFDPYPFTFLTLVVSLEAIFLSTFILISQNYELRLTDQRNQLELQINLLNEQESTKMLVLLGRIAHKLGIEEDPSLNALTTPIRPEKLAQQIAKVYAREDCNKPRVWTGDTSEQKT